MPEWVQVAIAAAPVVVPFIISLATLAYKGLLQQLPTAQREEAARLIQVLVVAAEQSMPGATGEAKKAAVEQDIEAIFKASHLHVPPALVDAFIESAVATLDQSPGQPEPVGFHPPTVVDGLTV